MSQNESKANKRSAPRDRAITAAVIGAVAVIGAALITVFLSHGGGNGTNTTPTISDGSPQASGSITYPASGATNIPSPKTLTAAGTVQHLEPGHHLLVFLQFGDQQKYFGGDPDVVVSSTGHWSGTVCVGDPGAIVLWLVDMGPAGFAALENSAHNYWGNGVPFLPSKLARDVAILDRVSITAARTPTACSKSEPQYYG